MKIAGRCSCGMSENIVQLRPDSHLACIGLRWCGQCGEAAELRKNCIPCHREQARLWAAEQRRLNTFYYQHNKAQKRRRWHEEKHA